MRGNEEEPTMRSAMTLLFIRSAVMAAIVLSCACVRAAGPDTRPALVSAQPARKLVTIPFPWLPSEDETQRAIALEMRRTREAAAAADFVQLRATLLEGTADRDTRAAMSPAARARGFVTIPFPWLPSEEETQQADARERMRT